MEVVKARGGELEAEALEALRAKPAIYHCVSRVVNREYVLGRAEKEQFVRLMRLYERFCQVRVLTYCVMSNHFHLQLEVPARPEEEGASWSDEALLDDSTRLAKRASAAGVSVDIQLIDDVFHVFQIFTHFPESQDALSEIGAFYKRHI